MTTQMVNDLINEIHDKYGEWIEMAGNRKEAVYGIIVTKLLLEHREKINYLEKRLSICERETVKGTHEAANRRVV